MVFHFGRGRRQIPFVLTLNTLINTSENDANVFISHNQLSLCSQVHAFRVLLLLESQCTHWK